MRGGLIGYDAPEERLAIMYMHDECFQITL